MHGLPVTNAKQLYLAYYDDCLDEPYPSNSTEEIGSAMVKAATATFRSASTCSLEVPGDVDTVCSLTSALSPAEDLLRMYSWKTVPLLDLYVIGPLGSSVHVSKVGIAVGLPVSFAI